MNETPETTPEAGTYTLVLIDAEPENASEGDFAHVEGLSRSDLGPALLDRLGVEILRLEARDGIRHLCLCEVEDDGDGENGPHLSIKSVDEACPMHGRLADPVEWERGESMNRGYVLSGVRASLPHDSGIDIDGWEDVLVAMVKRASAAFDALGEDDGHNFDRAIGCAADALLVLHRGLSFRSPS